MAKEKMNLEEDNFGEWILKSSENYSFAEE